MNAPITKLIRDSLIGRRGRTYVLYLLLISLTISVPAFGQQKRKGSSKKTALEIVSDSLLWSRNFRMAISSAEALANEGQRIVELFPDAIVSRERYGQGQEGLLRQKISSYNNVTKEAQASDLYKKFSKNLPFRRVVATVDTFNPLESDSVAGAIIFTNQDFIFRPQTKISDVISRLGKPQYVSSRVYHTEGDERPQILTLYSYADGVFVFAEADMAREAGVVNRVIVDIPKLVSALKTQLK